MFFFRHPKPVVDSRPVAEQAVQVKTVALPTLTELTEAPAAPQPGDTSAEPLTPGQPGSD